MKRKTLCILIAAVLLATFLVGYIWWYKPTTFLKGVAPADVARIEVEPDSLVSALGMRERIVSRLKGLGFAYVALDLQGYRTGSLNEPIIVARQGVALV